MPYESLLCEAEQLGIRTFEKPMPHTTKGLYADRVMWINQNIATQAEKACVVAEEIGHYHTTAGHILDQSVLSNRKQELQARAWAYKKLIPFSSIIQAHKLGVRNRYELADFLGVTENFLDNAINRFRDIYGTHTEYEGYTICFDPLGIVEFFD